MVGSGFVTSNFERISHSFIQSIFTVYHAPGTVLGACRGWIQSLLSDFSQVSGHRHNVGLENKLPQAAGIRKAFKRRYQIFFKDEFYSLRKEGSLIGMWPQEAA